MTTLDFVSTSTDGIRHADEPLISVDVIVASLGSSPALTLPMISGRVPDVDWIWHYLAEAAGFFGVTMPPMDELQLACERFTASAAKRGHSLLAVTVVLIEVAERAQFVITATPAGWLDSEPLHIAVRDGSPIVPSATDPLWRRMSARTTSRGEVDHLQRRLANDGFADQVAPHGELLVGPPMLGALVLEHGDGLVGIDNPGDPGVLELMRRSGLIRAGIASQATEFADPRHASTAWWISPGFQVHSVAAIGVVRYDGETVSPPIFLERLP